MAPLMMQFVPFLIFPAPVVVFRSSTQPPQPLPDSADYHEEAEWAPRVSAHPLPPQHEYQGEEPEDSPGGAGLYGTPPSGPGGSRIPRWSPPSSEEQQQQQHHMEQAAPPMPPGAAPLVPPSPGILSGGGFFPAPLDAAPAAPPVPTGVAFEVAAGDTAGGDDDDPQACGDASLVPPPPPPPPPPFLSLPLSPSSPLFQPPWSFSI